MPRRRGAGIVLMSSLLIACASPASAPTASPTITPTASAGPSTIIRSTETTGDASVTDLSFDGGRPTDAYLVAPIDAAGHSGRGVLWFHWLETGASNQNRTEFLEEAKALAQSDGVVSLLVDGTFPWREDPEGIEHDRAAIEAEVAMLTAAYNLLLAQPGVDPTRTALVGHDFGAMYSSVLFSRDPKPHALVMMAPTARWADWYLSYWAITDDADQYRATMAPLDPVTTLTAAGGRPVLLQFATQDRFIPADVADEITAAASAGAERHDYETGHELHVPAALSERDAWLLANL
jgi:predicted esterase